TQGHGRLTTFMRSGAIFGSSWRSCPRLCPHPPGCSTATFVRDFAAIRKRSPKPEKRLRNLWLRVLSVGNFCSLFYFPGTSPAGPHFRLNVFQKCSRHVLRWGPRGREAVYSWGRMSDAFASAHIAQFIQAPAVFIRCILGNHFAR